MIPNKTAVFATFSILIFAGISQSSAQDTEDGPDFYGIPAGTVIRVKMDNEINSESSNPGDTFTVTVADPVEIDGLVVLPIGTMIEGRVHTVKRAALGRRDGKLAVIFQTLFLDAGLKRDIEGDIELAAPKRNGSPTSILTVIGGGVAGAVVGAITQANNGALFGAGIGGGAALGALLLKKGSMQRIPAGSEFGIRLRKPVRLPAKGF